MRNSVTLASLALVLALGQRASADVPPPNGSRYVGFGVALDNAKSFPDYVFLAYPASTSDGVPMDEYQVISDGPISLGRRGGIPEIYAMKRADYDAWKAANPPSAHPSLQGLFNGDKVVRCTGASVLPVFQLPKSDPRPGITQTLKLESLDAKGCKLSSVADKPPTTEPPRTTEPAPATVPTSGPPVAPHHGCGGCAQATPRTSPWGLSALGLLVAALGRRKRRAVRLP